MFCEVITPSLDVCQVANCSGCLSTDISHWTLLALANVIYYFVGLVFTVWGAIEFIESIEWVLTRILFIIKICFIEMKRRGLFSFHI